MSKNRFGLLEFLKNPQHRHFAAKLRAMDYFEVLDAIMRKPGITLWELAEIVSTDDVLEILIKQRHAGLIAREGHGIYCCAIKRAIALADKFYRRRAQYAPPSTARQFKGEMGNRHASVMAEL